MTEQGENKDRKESTKALERLVISLLIGVGVGILISLLPLQLTVKLIIFVSIGLAGVLFFVGIATWWYGFELPRIRRKIKDNETKIAENKAQIAKNLRLIGVLKRLAKREPIGFDTYRWN